MAFIQDMERLVRLNPLVIAVAKAANKNVWKVTDRIMLLGFIPYHVDYEISAVFVDDGSDVSVLAPMGVRSFSKWRVSSGENTGCTVTEEASIDAPAYLLPFVKGTHYQAHEKMLERMAQKLSEEVSRS